jgi:hypothetical protein
VGVFIWVPFIRFLANPRWHARHTLIHNFWSYLERLKNVIYYHLKSQSYRNHIVSGATGTTVKHTSPSRIEEFVFPSPSNDADLQSINKMFGLFAGVDGIQTLQELSLMELGNLLLRRLALQA